MDTVSAAASDVPVMMMATMNPVQLAALSIAVAGCAWDLRTRRIPNLLTFGAAAAGLIYHVSTGGATALGYSALGWLVGVLAFIVPFALRGLGGGDVKLVAALGAWIGPEHAIWLALYTAVAGGVMAIVVSAANGYLRTAVRNLMLLLTHWRVAGFTAVPNLTLDSSSAPKLAYALPILVGMVTTLWLR
jgi:prepilin peptidase CpaA